MRELRSWSLHLVITTSLSSHHRSSTARTPCLIARDADLMCRCSTARWTDTLPAGSCSCTGSAHPAYTATTGSRASSGSCAAARTHTAAAHASSRPWPLASRACTVSSRHFVSTSYLLLFQVFDPVDDLIQLLLHGFSLIFQHLKFLLWCHLLLWWNRWSKAARG